MTLKKASGDRVEESLRTERQRAGRVEESLWVGVGRDEWLLRLMVGRDEWLLRLKVDCDSPHGVDSNESLTMH